MLVEFHTKNFRRQRNEQVLSLVAPKAKALKDRPQATGISATHTSAHRTAAYGANASDKSNLVNAPQYIRSMVTESATAIQSSQTFTVQPFRLDVDVDATSRPSESEVRFLLDGARHQYGLAMTAQRMVSEHLLTIGHA